MRSLANNINGAFGTIKVSELQMVRHFFAVAIESATLLLLYCLRQGYTHEKL
ncbi:hypothetical protein SHPE106448_21710 [Shewanella pealeana]